MDKNEVPFEPQFYNNKKECIKIRSLIVIFYSWLIIVCIKEEEIYDKNIRLLKWWLSSMTFSLEK